MRKQIVTTFVAATLLATGALANQDETTQQNCPTGQMMQGNMNMMQGQMMQRHAQMMQGQGQMMQGKMMRRSGGMGQNIHLMKVMRQLNLTDEQRDQIRSIMQENRQKRKTMSSFFTDNGFEKEKYEQFLQDKKDNAVKNKAQTIEKVYGILTDEQKKQFKTLLEEQEQRGMTNIEGQ